jgi:hypothetical protein
MGRLALEQPDNAKLLKDWKKQPGMLGVRLTFVLKREREWMRDGSADWFWAAAEAAEVPVMMHATGLMSYVNAIAGRHPAFGARRCLWGTDLSRALAKVTCRQCVTHFTQALTFLTDQDKEWIMGRGLAACLGW